MVTDAGSAGPWRRERLGGGAEDVVTWLAQQMAKTPIAGLLRIGWDTVGRIVQRVVAGHLDEARLSGLVAIGVDEISYRNGQRYLTSVVDHTSGRDRVVLTGPQRPRFTSCASPSARSTRSAATSGTPTTAHTHPRASGSRAPAGRC